MECSTVNKSCRNEWITLNVGIFYFSEHNYIIMVAFSRIEQQKGNGILDPILNTFTASKYPGEHHAYSLAPSTLGVAMNWMGPGTNINQRTNSDLTPKNDSKAINSADFHSYEHDIAYYKAKKNYDANPTPENRKIQLNKVWEADDKFIEDMKNDDNEPMAPIAGKLISIKKSLEQVGVLPTKTFEGFGVEKSDPVAKLRQLVQNEYKNEIKKENKVVKHNKQTGGLNPILVPIIASVLSTLTSKIFDTVKEKIQGKGYKMPNLKGKKRNDYIIDLIKQI